MDAQAVVVGGGHAGIEAALALALVVAVVLGRGAGIITALAVPAVIWIRIRAARLDRADVAR